MDVSVCPMTVVMRALLIVAVVLSVPSGQVRPACGSDSLRHSNILLLVADDMRPDAIAVLGNPYTKTPNLDELVRRGTVFTRATCGHPLCFPSRAELLTGCTGFRNGTYSELKLGPDVPLVLRIR